MGGLTAGVTAGLGATLGLAQFLGGRKTEREAQKRIDNFKFQELQNVGDTLSVSTLGADLQREESARALATSVDALQSGGVRGVVGGTGRVQAANQDVNRKIAADLDRQQKGIDIFKAQDDARIRRMEEKRQADELAGYGNLLDIGGSQKQQGLTSMFNAVGSFASGGGFGERTPRPTATGISPASTAGFDLGGSGIEEIDFSGIKF